MPPDGRLLIGIAGIPGSGKTTFSKMITSRLNAIAAKQAPGSPAPVAFLPMDGFHYPRSYLSAQSDAALYNARRGASFTFDASKFLAVISKLRNAPMGEEIKVPSFDHAVKDPKEDDIVIAPTQRIIVVEGNYVALNADVWREAAALFDELWFVEVDFNQARERLALRHVKAGIVTSLEDGYKRADENDLINGKEIIDNKMPIHEIIYSTEDDSWAPVA
ncbi:kinase-related protein [Cordyceps fumosorosea ARSEF 2679]|uniref:Kinase-related protein n=1 Tax=Cordyceps fumosorosea (strain ARSEF 2679) TaxID=1081104 RepID=A0A167W1A6_CORFA|nr:kinase-related protein [Cordyceps fumosorosea ARSEF 2679]OAA63211.1 kinase-related protein [Cordyceps fumosorosea ARSEF 2679]